MKETRLSGSLTPFVWFGMTGLFAYVGILAPLKWCAQAGMCRLECAGWNVVADEQDVAEQSI